MWEEYLPRREAFFRNFLQNCNSNEAILNYLASPDLPGFNPKEGAAENKDKEIKQKQESNPKDDPVKQTEVDIAKIGQLSDVMAGMTVYAVFNTTLPPATDQSSSSSLTSSSSLPHSPPYTRRNQRELI